jgi:sirohydrochlorin ferrochelatase
VGVHDGMADLIAACAADGCAARGMVPARTVVLVVGHGSARAPGRPLAVYRHVEQVAASGAFANVTAACLEEPPFVADVLRRLRDHPVAVVGFFAGEGGHVRDDIPALIAAEQDSRGPHAPPVFNFASVSENPAMARIILAQADAA